MSAKVREYRKGDEYGITDLFRISSGHTRTVDFWKWANLKCPFSKSISLVVEDDSGIIIGHYAVMIFRLAYKGRSFDAGFGSQLVIHPRFRNFKLMWELLSAVWGNSYKSGLSFIWAFPNDNIWQIKNRLMDWRLVREFRSLEFDLKDTRLNFHEEQGIKFQRINNLLPYKNQINSIWIKSTERYKNFIRIEKSYDFVNWRFFQHPLEHYLFYMIRDEKVMDIGWIVLKFYRKNGVLYGHIVDFIMADERLVKTLIMQTINIFALYGVDVVSAWGSESIKNTYEEMGFREKGFITNFGIKLIKLFDDKQIEQADITDYSKWDLNMSYSDAF